MHQLNEKEEMEKPRLNDIISKGSRGSFIMEGVMR
jgi:hypothetical protein